MFIGGLAVIAHGVPRYTLDIDATVLGREVSPERLVEAARAHQLVPRREDVIAFARASQVVLLRHESLEIPVDVSLAWMPFEEEAIEASQEADYQGVRIRVPRPEDLIVYKLIASRPRDLEDAGKLLALHGKRINVGRVEELVRPRLTRPLSGQTRAQSYSARTSAPVAARAATSVDG